MELLDVIEFVYATDMSIVTDRKERDAVGVKEEVVAPQDSSSTYNSHSTTITQNGYLAACV